MDAPSPPSELFAAVPHLVVVDHTVLEVSPGVADELGCDPAPLLGPIEEIGQRLDDDSIDDLISGASTLRFRLGATLSDRPVRLRRLGEHEGRTWLEIRSLADEFRLQSLLRRSSLGHMLLDADIQLKWSMTSNDISDVFPGDDPMNWIELMDPDDMETLGKAIAAVGADPNLSRTVRHRLNADRTYTIIDTVESAIHDPDLRGVLVRSRLEDSAIAESVGGAAPYAGMTVSDHMPIGVILASDQGKVLHRNSAAAELAAARAGGLIVPDGEERWIFDHLDVDASARYRAVFTSAVGGSAAHCTVPSPTQEGRSLRVSVSPAAASTVVLTIEDTTDLAEAESALRTSNRLLEALDSHSEDLVLVFDAVGRSRYVSSSVRRHLGEYAQIERASDVLDFVHDPDRPLVDDLVQRVRANPNTSGGIEFRVVLDGEAPGRWHHATMTNLLDDPDVQGMVLTLRDVHERHLVERELRFRATHDALTTLPDRAALQSQLETLLRKAEAEGTRTALVFCDVDNFKLINDRAGHRIGDLVLTEVASRLRSALRSGDFVGRFGGDEFVVVAPDADDEEHAIALATRVFESVVGPARCDDVDVEISLSMGVAITDSDCTTAAGLLHRGDLAMYESKRRGRGRLSPYSADIDLEGREQGAMRADLHRAIDESQLTLHYQPIRALKAGLESGVESLARWEHPEQGLIDAKRFLAIAESSGMTGELGDELVRLACADQQDWLAGYEGFISINLSSSQLGHPDAATSLLDGMREHGGDPSRLIIELTEAAFAQGPTVQANLDQFRAAKVRVFLDDFGVGYSSLSHLHHFPVDGIKIDASIVTPTVDDDLVRLIVGVATTLGIRTVAEGVETAEQLEIVTRHGVDYAQGHYLGRPERRLPGPQGVA